MPLGHLLALFKPISFAVQYLVAAGGGPGGPAVPFSLGNGLGGGAGGLKQGALGLTIGQSYAITVGAGGLGAGSTTGGNSSIAALVVTHGGGPGAAGGFGGPGGNGGSGGGGTPPGTGISGEGHSGDSSDGGGAAGAPTGGSPGAGVVSSISGSSQTYSGGGTIAGGSQGSGFGFGNVGASGPDGESDGQNGFGGVVIIRYPGPQRATGGTITTVGSDTVHTFTSSGTFTVTG